MPDHHHEHQQHDEFDIPKIVIASVVGMLLLGGALFAAYRYSQSKSAGVVLPGGVTYLGPSPSPVSENPPASAESSGEAKQPLPTTVKFTAASNAPWKTQYGRIYPYQFSFPETLPLVVFMEDPMDSVAISWGDIPAQQNILLNMELIEERDSALVTQRKFDYVTNWWKFFSGLKGVAQVEPFTNAAGLKGYTARYINNTDKTPNVDVFFEVPNKRNLMIHLANGILDPDLFDRIVDSVRWTPPAETP